MNGDTTRRDFLRTATAASGCLALSGLRGSAQSAAKQPTQKSGNGGKSPALIRETGTNTSIAVITQSISRDVNPRAGTWIYITEILQRAGLFFECLSPADVTALLPQPKPIVLLAGDLRLTSAQRAVLTTIVQRGGSVIGIGGTSGLDKVFGVSGARCVTEGWIKATAEDHPLLAGLRSSLHVFGGCTVKAGSATSLAVLESGKQGAKGSAILENRFGEGRAILLAPDLVFSIVHIQQGVPVFQDGKPAPDGSAEFNDGELKAEDGFVLDWQRDRKPMQPDGGHVFLEPITDDLREIILRSVFHAAKQQGIALPVLWYWPRALKAVGHISHDTDGNIPERAVALLEVMNRCKVKSTWCTLYPGGYPKDFYRTLKKQDFEIALHYDARTRVEHCCWSKEDFLHQHGWLLKEAEIEHITSNKNHYTRWEGRLDFLRWCEEVGINSDQTRGPSKTGAIGFPLGGSQPYFPLDDERDTPRFLNVLEVNMLTQDLVVVCPAEYGKQLVDSVLPRHGVAHFLFHPAHILKPNVADALCGLVEYGRSQGIEWWTSRQIYEWERLRRSVKTTFDSGNQFTLSAGKPLQQATLAFLKPPQRPQSITINGQPAKGTVFKSHGFEFDAVTLDLVGEVKIQIA